MVSATVLYYKMKLTDTTFATQSVKKFTNYVNISYKYKVVRVPALKDSVQSRKPPPRAAECINELTLMMDCWKRTDYSHTACGSETQGFLKCIAVAEAERKEALIRESKGLPGKGSTLRPYKQVNEMLAKYPQPESNLK